MTRTPRRGRPRLTHPANRAKKAARPGAALQKPLQFLPRLLASTWHGCRRQAGRRWSSLKRRLGRKAARQALATAWRWGIVVGFFAAAAAIAYASHRVMEARTTATVARLLEIQRRGDAPPPEVANPWSRKDMQLHAVAGGGYRVTVEGVNRSGCVRIVREVFPRFSAVRVNDLAIPTPAAAPQACAHASNRLALSFGSRLTPPPAP